MSQIVKNGNLVLFDKKGCTIYDGDQKCVINVKQNNGVYKVKNTEQLSLISTTKNVDKNCAMQWHRKLGHLNYSDLCKMKNVVDGVVFSGGAEEVKH